MVFAVGRNFEKNDDISENFDGGEKRERGVWQPRAKSKFFMIVFFSSFTTLYNLYSYKESLKFPKIFVY